MSLKPWKLESVSLGSRTVSGNTEQDKLLTGSDRWTQCNSEPGGDNWDPTKRTILQIKPTEEKMPGLGRKHILGSIIYVLGYTIPEGKLLGFSVISLMNFLCLYV